MNADSSDSSGGVLWYFPKKFASGPSSPVKHSVTTLSNIYTRPVFQHIHFKNCLKCLPLELGPLFPLSAFTSSEKHYQKAM